MRRNILNSVLAIMLLTFLGSCRAKKDLVKSGPSSVAISGNKAEALKLVSNNTAKYSTLSIKAKADLDIAGNENDATLTLRIRRGEAIWVSVTALAGLEIARVLITPDSIKIRNNLESTYISKPFSYLYEFTSPEINFSTLETIIAGNPQKEVVTEQADLSIQGNQYILKKMVGSLIHSINFNELNKVALTNLKDEAADQEVFVRYGDFIKVEDQIFPHLVNIKSRVENKNVVIDLVYNRIGINEVLDMPFSIPKRFTVKN